MDAYLLHVVSHVVECGEHVRKNNESLKASPDQDAPRDQGFTRPRVLILLPTRNLALRVVLRLCELAQRETRADSIQQKDRLLREFNPPKEEGEEDGPTTTNNNQAGQEASKPGNRGKGGKGVPIGLRAASHAAVLEENIDDHFRLGIKITRGAVRLFTDFYKSDVVVASPIGLVAGREEETADDFLSSIEVVIVDRTDVLSMQNWAHVTAVFQGLNRVPRELHGADVMRVRLPFLNGEGARYRQTIVLSSILTPQMNSLFNRFATCIQGQAVLRCSYKVPSSQHL
eukprot:jgi/Botrbrau1/16158/Bobra.0309s0007.1